MSDIAIRVERLSKRYRLGEREPYKSLREVITRTVQAPLGWLRGKPIASSGPEYIWALDDVSFDVKQGEAVGIIGRNGAGKSTLLKVLSRITKPTRGKADIYGRVGSLLEVGTGFHPELTGRENIYLNGVILGMKRQEIACKFDEIVDFAEIEKFLDTPVKRYSSGMYVRLAFAVAAHLEPEILLVDEVLAVGDAEFQKKCLGKMGEVTNEGRTVLFVSHNMPSIQSLCNRVILLQTGVIKVDSNPITVISQYLSEGFDSQSADVDLRHHSGRSHSIDKALQRAWITNQDGEINNKILMGGNLIVNCLFHCREEIKLPGFGILLEDERGEPIFSINNFVVASEKNTFKSILAGTVSFSIPNLPLMPGTYHINLAITANNDHEWIDYVERAISIHILPSDVHGTGKISHQSLGNVFVSGEVYVKPIDIEISGS